MDNCQDNGCAIEGGPVTLTPQNNNALVIQFVSDYICPWCLIGKVRLKKAIMYTAPYIGIAIRWIPFELNPDIPIDGIERKAYRTKKFGSWERSLELDAQVNAAAAKDGLAFRHDLMLRTPNTRKAHRLTWLAEQENKAGKLSERLLNAYFLEGKDIGDSNVLASLAAEVGMDKEKVQAFLLTNLGLEEVRTLEDKAIGMGIRGVPLTIIGDKTLSGAHAVETFAEAIRDALRHQKIA